MPIAAEAPVSYREILLLVGQLNYTWTNTESLLIYLIAGLARTDKETAIVIFLTLNTSKARLELVDRLGKMSSTPQDVRLAILAVTRQLTKLAKLRNKYSHCIYSFDEDGSVASTQLMRLVESDNTIRYGKVEAVDRREVGRIEASIMSLQKLNREIWALIEERGFPT